MPMLFSLTPLPASVTNTLISAGALLSSEPFWGVGLEITGAAVSTVIFHSGAAAELPATSLTLSDNV